MSGKDVRHLPKKGNGAFASVKSVYTQFPKLTPKSVTRVVVKAETFEVLVVFF